MSFQMVEVGLNNCTTFLQEVRVDNLISISHLYFCNASASAAVHPRLISTELISFFFQVQMSNGNGIFQSALQSEHLNFDSLAFRLLLLLSWHK